MLIATVIVLFIIIVWYFLGKNNILNQKHSSMSAIEYVDITPLVDSCGKDITYSSRLLKDLYGEGISDKVVIFNKNDDLLYSHKWTSVNICKFTP